MKSSGRKNEILCVKDENLKEVKSEVIRYKVESVEREGGNYELLINEKDKDGKVEMKEIIWSERIMKKKNVKEVEELKRVSVSK